VTRSILNPQEPKPTTLRERLGALLARRGLAVLAGALGVLALASLAWVLYARRELSAQQVYERLEPSTVRESTVASDEPTPTPMPTRTSAPTPTAAVPAPTLAPAQELAISAYELSGDSLAQARSDYELRLAQLPQILNETFDSATTKQSWHESYEDEGRRIRLVNRYYELLVKPPNTIASNYWDGRALGQEYLVQLDVAVSTPGSYAGILFDRQDERNYSVFMIGDSTWYATTFQDGVQIDARSGEYRSAAIVGGGNTNQLRVVRSPERSEFWVNNTLVGEMQPGAVSNGNVGLAGASGSEVPATLIFDNLYIWTR
jgi:hypothetical protein